MVELKFIAPANRPQPSQQISPDQAVLEFSGQIDVTGGLGGRLMPSHPAPPPQPPELCDLRAWLELRCAEPGAEGVVYGPPCPKGYGRPNGICRPCAVRKHFAVGKYFAEGIVFATCLALIMLIASVVVKRRASKTQQSQRVGSFAALVNQPFAPGSQNLADKIRSLVNHSLTWVTMFALILASSWAIASSLIMPLLLNEVSTDLSMSNAAHMMHCKRSKVEDWSQSQLVKFIAWAPGYLKGFIIALSVSSACRWAGGFQAGPGLVRTVFVGTGSNGSAEAADWAQVVGSVESELVLTHAWTDDPMAGDERLLQSSWEQARAARGLTRRQAIFVSVLKLFLWHFSQPVAYLVVLRSYRCYVHDDLGDVALIAIAVGVREVQYLICTIVAAKNCPVFLLIDLVTVWKKSETHVQGCVRLSTYILGPHVYVLLCLANHFSHSNRLGLKTYFVGLAGFHFVIDTASCVALGVLLFRHAHDHDHAPAALFVGYTMTATSIIFFYGPSAILTCLEGSFLAGNLIRGQQFFGIVLLVGWIYMTVGGILLALGHDIVCMGYASFWVGATCSSGGKM